MLSTVLMFVKLAVAANTGAVRQPIVTEWQDLFERCRRSVEQAEPLDSTGLRGPFEHRDGDERFAAWHQSNGHWMLYDLVDQQSSMSCYITFRQGYASAESAKQILTAFEEYRLERMTLGNYENSGDLTEDIITTRGFSGLRGGNKGCTVRALLVYSPIDFSLATIWTLDPESEGLQCRTINE